MRRRRQHIHPLYVTLHLQHRCRAVQPARRMAAFRTLQLPWPMGTTVDGLLLKDMLSEPLKVHLDNSWVCIYRTDQ